MEISYKREMKHNYLVIEGENQENSYEVRMMAGNIIEGLMKFRLKRVDDRRLFCYEITSRQPLNRLLESKSLKAENMRFLFLEMSKTLNRMEEYLLKENQILLQPEYIYVEPELFTVEFCLIPGRNGNFPEELCKLLEYLLGKIDYQDKECVVMTYGMYRESLKENYGMEDLLIYLSIMGDRREEQVEAGTGATSKDSQHVQQMGQLNQTEKPFKKSWRERLYSKVKQVFGINIRSKSSKLDEGADTQLPWQMILEDKNTGYEEMRQSTDVECRHKVLTLQESDDSKMVLAADVEEEQFRRLISMEDNVRDICIAYYPFIIGKQENLVDYLLKYDTVSRLHLKMDEENGIYKITDLNSTNGTEVAGILLENNEAMEVKPGDEVIIGKLHFRFV